jgi:predicted nucleic acid-binding Zn ribbon protein
VIKSCVVCGGDFEPKKWESICSDKCAKKRTQDYAERCASERRNQHATVFRNCVECGDAFESERIKAQIVCSEACRANRLRRTTHTKRLRNCVVCDGIMASNRQKFCSHKCYYTAVKRPAVVNNRRHSRDAMSETLKTLLYKKEKRQTKVRMTRKLLRDTGVSVPGNNSVEREEFTRRLIRDLSLGELL